MKNGIVLSEYYDFFVPDSIPISDLSEVINSNLDTIASPAILVKKTNRYTVNENQFLDTNQASFRINKALSQQKYLINRKANKTARIVFGEFRFESKTISIQEFKQEFRTSSHYYMRIPLNQNDSILKTYYLKDFKEISSELKTDGKTIKLKKIK